MLQAPERLTVFLITYNHVKYIRKCFDSILEQQTGFPFKIIVLEDASTDGTSDIVREYVAKYPDRITAVINEKNLGFVENIYRAQCKIDTPYFATIEGDDHWCDSGKLQRQVDLLDRHPEYDMCGHDVLIRRFDTGEEKRMYDYDLIDDTDVIFFEGRDMPKVHPLSRVYRHVYDFSKVSPHAAVAWDSCIFWFYCLQNPKFIFINQPLGVYNYTGEGIYSGASRNKQKLMALQSIVALNEGLGYKYNDFNRERFRKALYKPHRLLFPLVYLLMRRRAYDWFIRKYSQV